MTQDDAFTKDVLIPADYWCSGGGGPDGYPWGLSPCWGWCAGGGCDTGEACAVCPWTFPTSSSLDLPNRLTDQTIAQIQPTMKTARINWRMPMQITLPEFPVLAQPAIMVPIPGKKMLTMRTINAISCGSRHSQYSCAYGGRLRTRELKARQLTRGTPSGYAMLNGNWKGRWFEVALLVHVKKCCFGRRLRGMWSEEDGGLKWFFNVTWFSSE